MKYVVYVLSSRVVERSYVGSTNNLKRRLEEHNLGKNYYTRRYMPWDVIYTEEYGRLEIARKREKMLKSTTGRRYLKKVFA